LVFVVLAIFASRVPSLGWAVGIWVGRELIALPVMSQLTKSATTLGFIDQFRGVVVPLLASSIMAAAVVGARSILPLTWPPLVRLIGMAGVGGAVFVATVALLDRTLLDGVLQFVRSAIGRQRDRMAAPQVDGNAPLSSPAK